MPWFYVDDAFADSKPVMKLERAVRNEAIGLWVRCGAWSAKEETDGHVPLDTVRQFGGTPRLIRALHQQAGLWIENSPESWQKSREILFGNWEKWQKTRAELAEKRRGAAERQRRSRGQKSKGRNAVSSSDTEMSQRDYGVTENDSHDSVTRDPHAYARRPDPTRPLTDTHLDNESSPNVGGDERGLSEPVSHSASRLVAALIPPTIPAAVRTGLRLSASQLMVADGLDSDTVAEALRLWLAKPGAGHGLLPSLAADVIRARAAPGANGRPVHKLRATAQLAAEVRAQEQAELESANQRKALE